MLLDTLHLLQDLRQLRDHKVLLQRLEDELPGKFSLVFGRFLTLVDYLYEADKRHEAPDVLSTKLSKRDLRKVLNRQASPIILSGPTTCSSPKQFRACWYLMRWPKGQLLIILGMDWEAFVRIKPNMHHALSPLTLRSAQPPPRQNRTLLHKLAPDGMGGDNHSDCQKNLGRKKTGTTGTKTPGSHSSRVLSPNINTLFVVEAVLSSRTASKRAFSATPLSRTGTI